MEPQMPRPHVDQSYDHEHLPPSAELPPPSVTEGEEDEHHHHHHHQEKKSVLKKVKAKAKKIKETLTKHGHGHDHEHEHDYHQRHHIDEEEEDGDGDGDEDGDEDEDEMVEDSEVHGAPSIYIYDDDAFNQLMPFYFIYVYESDTIRSGVNLGKPMTVVGEDHWCESKLTTEPPPTRPFENSGPPPIANVMRRSTTVEGSESESTGNFLDIRRKGGDTGIKMGTSTALEEDPRAPPQMSNYHTKVTHPNAAPESKSKPKPQGAANLYTGSHDQFSPEPLPLHTTTNREDLGSVLKRFDATKPEDMPRDTFSKQPSDQSSGYTYTEKISSATSAIADKAVTAKNVVASKLLGYGSNEDTTATSTSTKNTHQGDEETTDKAGSVAEYGHKIAAAVTEKLAPMYEKVTDVGSSVMSKVHNTCTDSDTSPGQERGDEGQGGGVSVKEYLVKKLRPSEEDKLLSEMISDALHKRKQEAVEEKPMGKVTESEEVARRLGNTSRGSSDEDSSIREGTATDSGKAVAVAVVDRLKGAVSTWFFSGRDQSQTSQPSLAHGIPQLFNNFSYLLILSFEAAAYII